MKRIRSCLAFVLSGVVWVSLSGCINTFSGDFKNTPEGNYDFFFHELEIIYAYRDYRFENNLTLKEIRSLERSKLLANPTWDNLANVLGRVVYTHIADPHVNWTYAPIPKYIQENFFWQLEQKRSNQYYIATPSFPNRNFNLSLRSTEFMDYLLIDGTDSQPAIGYLYIKTLTRNGVDSNEKQNQQINSDIDRILKFFREGGADRVIIDIRSDAGGSALISGIIASRFITHTQRYSIFSEPTSANEFVDQDQYISPDGYSYFQDKPLVIMINTLTCSAGEILLLMLRKSGGPNRVIGTNTLGCTGSTFHRELPNGWIFQVTITRSYDADGKDYFKNGLTPDIKLTDIPENFDLDFPLVEAVKTVRGL